MRNGPGATAVVKATAASAAPAAAEAPPEVTAASARRHLYEIDLVRLLTFFCVIGVHAVPLTTDPQSRIAGAVTLLLHFTRDTFFLLSAFVLVYANQNKTLRVGRFWARRFYYIGVPYAVWTVVYWLLNSDLAHGHRPVWSLLGRDLLEGTGEYHLYFLLVSMQLYVVFPLLQWLLRRTAGHHLTLFFVSAVVQIAELALILYVRWPAGALTTLQDHIYALLPAYQFYFIAGGIAALHAQALRRWVSENTRTVVLLMVVTGAVLLAGYVVRLAQTGNPAMASDPLSPLLVIWSVPLSLGFLALGSRYARHRSGRLLDRFIDTASVASFGVYLVHPLILNAVLGRWLAYRAGPIPAPASTILAWVTTFAVSFVIAAVLVRTPFALPLTGRARVGARVGPRDRTRPPAAAAPATR